LLRYILVGFIILILLLVSEIIIKDEFLKIKDTILQGNNKIINTFLIIFNIACIILSFLGSIFMFILARKYDKINKSNN